MAEVKVTAHQSADAGHGHQSPTDAIMPNDVEHRPMQGVKLGAQRLTHVQHRLDHPLKHRLLRRRSACIQARHTSARNAPSRFRLPRTA